ncbi:MAG: hypothetical protein ACI84C_002869 [Flavobacteriales bacterium]|jgi:hypothetical protein
MAINTINFFAIFGMLLLASCSGSSEETKFSEGTIIYDVSFPFQQDDILVNLYPTEMVMDFKDNQVRMSMQSLGGLVATEFVLNNATREFSQILRALKERHIMNLDEAEVKEMVASMPRMIMTPTNETDSLAGYLCKKTMAVFDSDSVPPIALWHTDQIDLTDPNWCNQFYDSKDVLLGYEVEQYGMRMRLRARSAIPKEISDSKFELPFDYAELDYLGMRNHVENLLGQFMNNEEEDPNNAEIEEEPSSSDL